jgi:hypothetical protein
MAIPGFPLKINAPFGEFAIVKTNVVVLDPDCVMYPVPVRAVALVEFENKVPVGRVIEMEESPT